MEFLDNWLNGTMKNAVQKTTWLNYQRLIKQNILPALGNIQLQKLQPLNVQKLYNDLTERYSPNTVQLIHRILSLALSQAVLEKFIHHNFLKEKTVRLPKITKKEMQTFNLEEIRIFLKAAKASRYYAAFYLEIYTGLRRGELLGLRWQDIDLKNGTVNVVQQITMVGNKIETKELKTASSKRMIAIPEEVVSVLKEHKAKQEAELRHRGLNDLEIAEHFKTGLVFTTSKGDPVQPIAFGKSFKIVLKSGKLKDIRLHDLRHSFALLSLQAGTDIKTLQNDLGHSSIGTTLDIYGHVNEEMKRSAADKRSQLLKVHL